MYRFGARRNPEIFRVPNLMKHVCVAARIGEGKASGEGNSRSIAKTSNAAIADSGCNPSGWHEFWPMALSKGPLLRMTKPRDFLLALSQNRDSASRVSSCSALLYRAKRSYCNGPGHGLERAKSSPFNNREFRVPDVRNSLTQCVGAKHSVTFSGDSTADSAGQSFTVGEIVRRNGAARPQAPRRLS